MPNQSEDQMMELDDPKNASNSSQSGSKTFTLKVS